MEKKKSYAEVLNTFHSKLVKQEEYLKLNCIALLTEETVEERRKIEVLSEFVLPICFLNFNYFFLFFLPLNFPIPFLSQ